MGQNRINEAESKNIKGRILEREDESDEVVVKWEFENLLDYHNKNGLHYLIKWKHHRPSWQPTANLKSQNEAILDFHQRNPNKPGPPSWVRKANEVKRKRGCPKKMT